MTRNQTRNNQTFEHASSPPPVKGSTCSAPSTGESQAKETVRGRQTLGADNGGGIRLTNIHSTRGGGNIFEKKTKTSRHQKLQGEGGNHMRVRTGYSRKPLPRPSLCLKPGKKNAGLKQKKIMYTATRILVTIV